MAKKQPVKKAEVNPLEKAKALINLGVSVENAVQYAGGGFSDEEKAELAHCEFQHKIEVEKKYEAKLDQVIDVQIDKGQHGALIWAMEHKIPKYAAKGLEGGDIHIHVDQKNADDIIEEG